MSVRIVGTGAFTPEKILTNADLEKMVETSDEWITTRTGIRQRHIAEEQVPTSFLAAQAARRAMENAGITPDQIDFISVATVTPDMAFPSTACYVQKEIQADHAMCYDLEAACSGLLYSLEVGYSLLKTFPKKYRYGLVIGSDKLSSIVDWKDRSTCVLFGDAASAVILKNEEDGLDEDFLIASRLGAQGIHAELLQLPAGGSAHPASHETIDGRMHYIKMGGQEVFKLAVTGMVSACKEVMLQSGFSCEEVAWVIPHQANKRIISAVAQRLAFPDEKVYVNIDRYGNTSAASIGICLDELNRAGQLRKGDKALLTAFGGGLTFGSMLIRW